MAICEKDLNAFDFCFGIGWNSDSDNFLLLIQFEISNHIEFIVDVRVKTENQLTLGLSHSAHKLMLPLPGCSFAEREVEEDIHMGAAVTYPERIQDNLVQSNDWPFMPMVCEIIIIHACMLFRTESTPYRLVLKEIIDQLPLPASGRPKKK